VEGDGVYFSSLECDSLLATTGASLVVGIPYKYASMSRERTKERAQEVYQLTSERRSLCVADSFRVQCQWRRLEGPDATAIDTKEWRGQAKFFVERYHVYTQSYGYKLRGQVQHEPWPCEPVCVDKLDLSNTHAYAPAALRSVVQLMANRAPDHACFSPGVEDVKFHMLAPYHAKP
jgi:uncharacterized protein YqjF (DUF2071 family)